MTDAAGLLNEARKVAADGYDEEAKRIYRLLIANHLTTSEAQAARTELDELEKVVAPDSKTGQRSAAAPVQLVQVVDIDISFLQMVWLMIKLSIAAIPAVIVLAVIAFILMAMLGVTINF